MSLAAQLRGISELMLDIALGEQEELIHGLLYYSRLVATKFAHALIECNGHSTSIGDSIAGPDLLSPKHNKKFAWKHEKRLVHELKKNGVILHLHICGDTVPILKDFIAMGAPVLEVDHKTDIQKIKDAAHNRTCLLGNINTGLIMNGTPEEVDDACRELKKYGNRAVDLFWDPGAHWE